MDKSGYTLLFQEAARRALDQAGLSAALNEPMVEYHGKPNPQRCVTMDEALNCLWLSEGRFYRVLDVAAYLGEDNPPVIFVRPAWL